MTLEELRKNIDIVDDNILELMNNRMDLVHQVGVLKRSTKQVIYRPEREKEIMIDL